MKSKLSEASTSYFECVFMDSTYSLPSTSHATAWSTSVLLFIDTLSGLSLGKLSVSTFEPFSQWQEEPFIAPLSSLPEIEWRMSQLVVSNVVLYIPFLCGAFAESQSLSRELMTAFPQMCITCNWSCGLECCNESTADCLVVSAFDLLWIKDETCRQEKLTWSNILVKYLGRM